MIQESFNFIGDICEARHRRSPESIIAHSRVDKHKGQSDVLAVLKEHPATSKEIAVILHKPLNAISGRCSELKALDRIEKTGIRREGSAELRIKQ